MNIRYIIRPRHILSTPKILKESLEAKRIISYPFSPKRRPSLLKDFFLSYPPIETLEEYVENATIYNNQIHKLEHLDTSYSRTNNPILNTKFNSYLSARDFFISTKYSQRIILHGNIGGSFPIPITSTIPGKLEYTENPFIVRPLTHSKGEGWRLTKDSSDFLPTKEYIQELFEKDFEYRVICVRGEPLITLLKKNSKDIPKDQPWNYSNGSHFVTITDLNTCRLQNTDVFDRIHNSPLLKCIDLAGIDILYKQKPPSYVITEINLCPALQIEENVRKIAKYIQTL